MVNHAQTRESPPPTCRPTGARATSQKKAATAPRLSPSVVVVVAVAAFLPNGLVPVLRRSSNTDGGGGLLAFPAAKVTPGSTVIDAARAAAQKIGSEEFDANSLYQVGFTSVVRGENTFVFVMYRYDSPWISAHPHAFVAPFANIDTSALTEADAALARMLQRQLQSITYNKNPQMLRPPYSVPHSPYAPPSPYRFGGARPFQGLPYHPRRPFRRF